MIKPMRIFQVGTSVLFFHAALAQAAPVSGPISAQDKARSEREFRLGAGLSQQGQMDEAIRHTLLAVQLDPGNANAEYNLGIFYNNKKDSQNALLHARRSVRLDPKNFNARLNYAVILQAAGRKEEAMAQYREVLKLIPDHPVAHYNLGVLMTAAGKKGAGVHCRRAAALNPALSGPACNTQL